MRMPSHEYLQLCTFELRPLNQTRPLYSIQTLAVTFQNRVTTEIQYCELSPIFKSCSIGVTPEVIVKVQSLSLMLFAVYVIQQIVFRSETLFSTFLGKPMWPLASYP